MLIRSFWLTALATRNAIEGGRHGGSVHLYSTQQSDYLRTSAIPRLFDEPPIVVVRRVSSQQFSGATETSTGLTAVIIRAALRRSLAKAI